MVILGIDTSCDETAIAAVEVKNFRFKILANIVSSQVKLHAKYGGVYPSLAKREHQKNLPKVFKEALRLASLSQGKPVGFNLIAVTRGPGLEPCLWQGINFAKDLALELKKPIIPVNHIEAHIAANFIGGNSKFEIRNSKLFPAVCLVVSGGHTQLILMKGIGKYQLIGETRDDAAGECFDKAARILGLSYPGGPAIAKFASQWKSEIRNSKSEIELPRPMIHTKDYDFSFSGLKTAVLYKVKELKTINYKLKTALCAEIQQAIIDVLIYKTLKAAKDFRVKSIMLGGGVVANTELRRQFKEKVKKEIPGSKFYIPDSKYCTDNAVMIAVAAFFHKNKKADLLKLKADGNLSL